MGSKKGRRSLSKAETVKQKVERLGSEIVGKYFAAASAQTRPAMQELQEIVEKIGASSDETVNAPRNQFEKNA